MNCKSGKDELAMKDMKKSSCKECKKPHAFQTEWISVEDELPPQKWRVIVKNGKTIVDNVTYHYKKWYHCSRNLHQVTHWKFSEDRKPSIPPKDMRNYLRRAEKYRHQMKKKTFRIGPITGLYFGKYFKPQSAIEFVKEMEDEQRM
jgi:hypothetical protein